MKKAFLLRLVCAAFVALFLLAGCAAKNDANGSGRSNEPDNNPDAYDHITFTLPDGFTVYENEGYSIAYSPEYPAKTDHILFSKSEKSDVNRYTQESFEQSVRNTLPGFIRSTEFQKIKIDGADAIKYAYLTSASGTEFTVTQYMIFGDTFSDIIAFTSVSGDYDAAFEAVAASIRVK